MNSATKLVSTAAAVLVLAAGTLVIAGPLDPPLGPVGSTFKTLTEMEPRIAISSANTPGDADSVYRITAPGSYYLTADVAGQSGLKCIEVVADDVTIDLNGMTVRGVADSIGGIFADGIRHNLTVRNGTIKGVGAGPGLGFTIATTRGWKVENVTAVENGGEGLLLPIASIIRSCRTESNGGIGIKVGERSRITDCVSDLNGSDGVSLGGSSIAVNTVCRSNTGNGINGNSDGVRIMDCVVTGNAANGIVGLNAAHITGCVSRSNGVHGITTASAAIIENNNVTFNGTHGIAMTSNSVVTRNSCHSNGTAALGAGIFTNGFRSRIEDNLCNDNDYGIRVTTSSNFIARNVVGSNTTLNWDIAQSNRCLVVQSVSAAAISGNSGGTSPALTDPNANVTN